MRDMNYVYMSTCMNALCRHATQKEITKGGWVGGVGGGVC